MDKLAKSKIVNWWDENPCDAWHSCKSVDSLEFSQEISNHRQTHKSDILNYFDRSKLSNQKVLEVGCGIGTDGLNIARLCSEYVGVDVSQTAIDIAKKRFEVENLQGTFFSRDATSVNSLCDLGKFDIVYGWGVIHHWPEPENFLPNFYNALNTNGKLILSVYNEYSWKNALVKSQLSQYEAASNVPYVKCFSRDEIFKLLSPYFEIETIDLVGLMQYNLDSYKKNQFELEPWFKVMPPELISAIEKHLGELMVVIAKPKNIEDKHNA